MEPMIEAKIEEIAHRVALEVVEKQTIVIAEAAAKRAIQLVAADVGMTLLKKISTVIGLAALAAAGWLMSKGLWPAP